MQGARGLGRRHRRFIEQEVDLRQRRQTLIGADLAHVAHQRGATEDRNRHAGESGCLQTADTGADASDAPSEPRGFQPFDRMVAKNVARRQQRQGDRLFVMRRGLLPGHPDQLLLPHHLSAGEIVHAGDQSNIDLAALHTSDQRGRKRAVQLQLNARKGFAENPEDRGEHEGRIKVGRAQHDVPLDVGRGELRQQFVMKIKDRPRIAQHHLTLGRQEQPPAFMNEDGLSGKFLKSL